MVGLSADRSVKRVGNYATRQLSKHLLPLYLLLPLLVLVRTAEKAGNVPVVLGQPPLGVVSAGGGVGGGGLGGSVRYVLLGPAVHLGQGVIRLLVGISWLKDLDENNNCNSTSATTTTTNMNNIEKNSNNNNNNK